MADNVAMGQTDGPGGSSRPGEAEVLFVVGLAVVTHYRASTPDPVGSCVRTRKKWEKERADGKRRRKAEADGKERWKAEAEGKRG